MTTLEIVLLVALIASAALHAIAAKTKNTVDDAIADGLDAARGALEKTKK